LSQVSERQREKGKRFRALHAGEPFVIPNPWDAGTAKVLEALGFPALATTSSGFAFSLGRPDGEASLDEVIEHTRPLDRRDLRGGSTARQRRRQPHLDRGRGDRRKRRSDPRPGRPLISGHLVADTGVAGVAPRSAVSICSRL